MRKSWICALGVVMWTGEAGAQSQWLARIRIRETTDTRIAARPAVVQYTNPDSGNSSYSLALGVMVDVSPNAQLEIGPFVDIQKNTLASKRQDVRKYGVAVDYNLYKIGSDAGKTWTPVVAGQLNRKEDRVTRQRGTQATLAVSAVFRGRRGDPRYFYIPNIISEFGPVAAFRYAPLVGVESAWGKQSDTSESTSVQRLYGAMQADVYPLQKIFDYRLVLSADLSVRHGSSPENGRSRHYLRQYSAVFVLLGAYDDGPSASIAVDRISGDDPGNSFLLQRFTRLALKVRI